MNALQRRYAYRVHCGYTRKGNDRWARFFTEESARAFCADVFARSGIVLCIQQVTS